MSRSDTHTDPLLPTSTSEDPPDASPSQNNSSLASINNLLSALHSASRLGRADSRLPRLPLVRLQLRHASDDDEEGGEGVRLPSTATWAAASSSVRGTASHRETPTLRGPGSHRETPTAHGGMPGVEGGHDSGGHDGVVPHTLHRRELSVASSGRQDSANVGNVAASAERHRLHNATVVDLQVCDARAPHMGGVVRMLATLSWLCHCCTNLCTLLRTRPTPTPHPCRQQLAGWNPPCAFLDSSWLSSSTTTSQACWCFHGSHLY